MAAATVARSSEAQQWTRALNRAITDALDVLIEPISGEAFVESASNPGTLYIVTASTCSCPAGERGGICKHRAALLAQMGELPTEPAPAIREIPIIECPDCCGGGVTYNRDCERVGWPHPPCDVCAGTGLVAA
jgi:SWIM zinc finger